MKARTRTLRAAIVALVTGVAVLVVAGVAMASTLYCGSGRGPTPEYAIKKAIYDAEVSAEGDGLFTCTIVGEPSVWFVPYESYRGAWLLPSRRELDLQLTPVRAASTTMPRQAH
jgi:hypothetical protein